MDSFRHISRYILIATLFVVLMFLLIFVRETEDVWICENSQWVPHGAPDSPAPTQPCNENNTGTRNVVLYYYDPTLDKDETGNTMCSRNGLIQVERQIPITKTLIQDTIRLLISGSLTDKELSNGITTEYPLEELTLKGASLNDGALTLEFDDPNNKTGGGSCRVGILWFQIEATAKQFPEVETVRFLPEELFQP